MSLSHVLSQHSVIYTNIFYPVPAPPCSKFIPHPHTDLCGFPHLPRKCGYPQPALVNPSFTGLL